MHWRLCDIVARLASERRTALVFVDEYGHRRDYAFDEVAAHSARYAAVLRAFGVHEGERVYVRLSTAAKAIFTLLALERLGVQPVLERAAADGASTIISNRVYRAEIDTERDRFATDARYVIIGEEREGWARLDTLAQVASIEPPQTAAVDEAGSEEARARAFDDLGAVPTDVVWYAMQIEAPRWFELAIERPWLLGCAAVAHGGEFEPRERLDLARELDVTILLQHAGEYHAELAIPDLARFKMPRLRRCMVIGEECDAALESQWEERFGVPLTTDGAAVSRPPKVYP